MTAPCIEQMNANSTHIPILAGIVSQTTGPVVEFGVGHYSTPMLHCMCKNRMLLSVENNKEWHDWFRGQWEDGDHDFALYENQNLSDGFFCDSKHANVLWDVAFVDCLPEKDRKRVIEKIKGQARFIVVHDSEPNASIYEWGNTFNYFKHELYWNFYGNGTTVVSMFQEIPLRL